LFSQYASEAFLLLFDSLSGDPTNVIRIEKKIDSTWQTFVEGIRTGQFYGYKIHGEYNPAEGKRFNPHKLLIESSSVGPHWSFLPLFNFWPVR